MFQKLKLCYQKKTISLQYAELKLKRALLGNFETYLSKKYIFIFCFMVLQQDRKNFQKGGGNNKRKITDDIKILYTIIQVPKQIMCIIKQKVTISPNIQKG